MKNKKVHSSLIKLHDECYRRQKRCVADGDMEKHWRELALASLASIKTIDDLESRLAEAVALLREARHTIRFVPAFQKSLKPDDVAYARGTNKKIDAFLAREEFDRD